MGGDRIAVREPSEEALKVNGSTGCVQIKSLRTRP
jgi:hypothetical protein